MLKMMLRSVSRGAAHRALRPGSPFSEDIARSQFGKANLGSAASHPGGVCVCRQRRGRNVTFFRGISHAMQDEGRGEVTATAERKSTNVPQPPVAAFNDELVNRVQLTGVVVGEPTERELQNTTLVSLDLAVPRKQRWESGDQITYDYVALSFFGFSGQQAKEHLPKGAKVFVRGRLNRPSKRFLMSVSVDDFGLVDEESWPIEGNPEMKIVESGAAQGKRLAVSPFLSPSKKRVYDDYRSNKTVKEIATERNIKESTVLSYLAENAFHGHAMDFSFLSRSCLLGPRGSIYMETDAVCIAIRSIVDDHNLSSIEEVPISDVHALLRQHKNGHPFQTQEMVINSVTYSQIATVMAMMKQGLTPKEWNAFKAPNETAGAKDKGQPSEEMPPPY